MANVSIKVNDKDKKEIERIFSELGLTISSATNAFFKQVILHNGIPFKLRTKNKLDKEISIPALDEAIAEYERGETIKCESFEEYKRKMKE